MALDIKRMRYFDGLFMKQEEFALDQDFFQRMRRLHNRHLHGYGIVWGLDVEDGPSTGEIFVRRGMAIDKFFDTTLSEEIGREMILTNDHVEDLSSLADGDYYIYIEYSESQADIVPDRGGSEPIHILEAASIGTNTARPDNEEQMTLAKVTVAAGAITAILTEENGEELRKPIVEPQEPIVVPTPTPTPTPTPSGDSQISVTAWTPFDMTIDADTTAPTKGSDVAIDQGFWRRVGDTMEIAYTYYQTTLTGAVDGSGDYIFRLPPGFTIDSTKAIIGSSTANSIGSIVGTSNAERSGPERLTGHVAIHDGTGLKLYVGRETVSADEARAIGSANVAMNNDALNYSFRAVVPIAEWTVGTVGSFNLVEYAYNTSASNADDTTSFAYGEAGGLVPAVSTSAKRKRVKFSKSFKFYRIEILQNGSWLDIGSTKFSYHTIIEGNNHDYGVFAESVSDTELDVVFSRDAWRQNDAGQTWATENTNGTRWRVVASDNPLFVENDPDEGVVSVTAWQQYDLQITGSISDPAKALNPSVDRAFWRRVGDSMEITYTYRHEVATGTAPGSGEYLFSLPDGFQIDTTKIDIGINGHGVCGSFSGHHVGTFLGEGSMFCYTTTTLAAVLHNGGGTSTTLTAARLPLTSNPMLYSFRATVPIAGWTTGTVGSFNKVEYVYNTSTTNATDTTSYAAGESGGLVPNKPGQNNVNVAIDKQIQFSRAFKHVKLEFSQGGSSSFVDVGSSPFSKDTFENAPGTWHSAGAELTKLSDTTYNVRFYGFSTFGDAGPAGGGPVGWATDFAAGTRWRVVGSDNPLFVEGGGAESQVSVTAWTAYDLTIAGSTASPTKATTPDIDAARWRRVGDSMEITYSYRHTNNTGAQSGSGVYLFKIPDGFTIDQTKVNVSTQELTGVVGSATSDNGAAKSAGIVKVYDTNSLALMPDSDGTAIDHNYVSHVNFPLINATTAYSFHATVPIAEFTVGTVGSFNKVEYAFNSSTNDGNDTTSSAFGEEGSVVPPATSAIRKRVEFSKEFKHYKLEVQVNGIGPWLDLASAGFDQIETSGHRGLVAEPISPTEFDVVFPVAGIAVAASLTTWTQQNANGTRYRMVGSDNPLFVEGQTKPEVSVTSWTPYDLEITASVTNPTKANNPITDRARWRRVGDSMEITYTYEHSDTTGATDGNGAYRFSLPPGFSIDSSKMEVGTEAGTGVCGTVMAHHIGTIIGTGFMFSYSPTQLSAVVDINSNTVSISSSNFTLGTTPLIYSFTATVPIAEWTTGTVGSFNRVEYAYNSSTANADDLTSFAYGEGGGAVPLVASSNKVKRVRFSRTFKHYQIEISENGTNAWWPADSVVDSGVRFGIRLNAISETELDVRFYSGGTTRAETWATANAAGHRWRVVGSDNPLFVEAETNIIAPIGSIQAWNKSMPATPSLPSGWLECNGQLIQDVESPYNGQTMPNLNQAPADPTGGATNTYTKGVFLRGDTTSGVLQDDAMQGHRHASSAFGGGGYTAGGTGKLVADIDSGTDVVGSPITDSSGTPRTATETRPVNFSVVWIMRVK